MKDCLEKKKRNNDDEDFQEEENQRVYAKFLRPDGKELHLPGVSEKDSIAYRIEALKVFLESALGDMAFIEAYQYLQENEDFNGKNESNDLQKILGKNIKYLTLIYQLIVCEDSYYSN